MSKNIRKKKNFFCQKQLIFLYLLKRTLFLYLFKNWNIASKTCGLISFFYTSKHSTRDKNVLTRLIQNRLTIDDMSFNF